jgi:hypothetical protein
MPPAPNDPREADRRRQNRVKRGLAWRKDKRRKEWRAKIADKQRRAKEARAEAEQKQKDAEARREQMREQEEKNQQQQEKQAEKDRGETQKRQAAGAAAGFTAGSALGRRAGTAIGTAVGGPVGAVVGGAIGGLVGGRIGSKLGGKAAGGGGPGGEGKGGAPAPDGAPGGGGAGGGAPPSGLPGVLPSAGEIAEQTQKALRLVGSAAKFAGEGLEKVARNDAIGLFAHGAHEAAAALDEIPVVGKVAGEALRTFTTVLTSANAVVGAFAERGRQISGYNGQLAGAAARQDVTRLMSDIREAQQMGDKYAKLLDKQSELEEVLKTTLMPIKELALDNLPAFIDFMMDAVVKLIEIGYLIPGVRDEKVKKIADDIAAIRAKVAAGAVGDPFDPLARAAAVAMGRGFGLGAGIAPAGPLAAPVPLGVPAVAAPGALVR